MTKITKESLKNYWWFRLLKVAFLFLMTISLIIIVGLAIEERPVLNKYSSTYQFKCSNEEIYRGDLKGSTLFFGYTNDSNPTFLYDRDAQAIRFICANPNITREEFTAAFEDAKTKGAIPSSNNFEIAIKESVYSGSWLELLQLLIGGVLGLFIIAWIIKVIFMYILIGEMPKVSIKEKIQEFRNTKKIINAEDNFTPKVTFKNSFFWYLLGLILLTPTAFICRVFITFVLESFGAELTSVVFQDIRDVSWIFALVLLVILINKIVIKRQINKNK